MTPLKPTSLPMVDEADSIMIDESRVPMVIAGASDAPPADRGMVSAIVSSLSREHWKTDGGERNVFLTDDGIDAVEDELARRLGHRAVTGRSI